MTVRDLLEQLRALGPEYLDAPVSLAADEYRLEKIAAGRDWDGPWVDLTTEYRERYACAEDPDEPDAWARAHPAEATDIKEWARGMFTRLSTPTVFGKFLK